VGNNIWPNFSKVIDIGYWIILDTTTHRGWEADKAFFMAGDLCYRYCMHNHAVPTEEPLLQAFM
jgi:hypothetical protein